MKKGNGFAIVLILIGVVIILGNMGVFRGETALFIMSLGLFGGYFAAGGRNKKGSIGFLIPASILLSIGTFSMCRNIISFPINEGSIFFIFLGTAFFLIYFIHNIKRKDLTFGEKNWPLITGASIYAFGVLIFLLENYNIPFIRIILQNLWPIILILVGLVIIIRNFRKS